MDFLIDDIIIYILKFLYPWESFGLCLASKRLNGLYTRALWVNYQLTPKILNEICNTTKYNKFKFSLNFVKYDELLINCSKIGNLVLAKISIENGAVIHANNNEALQFACMEGHLKVVKYLVSIGANIHVQDDRPLRIASGNGHLEVVKYLVLTGANIHVGNYFACRWASENGHPEVVEYLKSL
jgi:hypothetical protein